MWLRLVNGVYCFLPKDSCSSIQPLIHLLIFLGCFLGANNFLPFFSGCKVPGRRALSHLWGPGCAHTEYAPNEAITKCRLKLETVLADGKWKFKDGRRGVQSQLCFTEHILSLSGFHRESFPASLDPCCIRNSLAKQEGWTRWEGRDPVEKWACSYIIYQLYSSSHPCLSLFFYRHICLYILCTVYGKISIYNIHL